jgi:hypothetical protein
MTTDIVGAQATQAVERRAARLVVTGPGTYTGRRPRSVLKKAMPGAQIKRTGFPSVFVVETEGNVNSTWMILM